jgi:tetratricopeptide (TPR) repeat protein
MISARSTLPSRVSSAISTRWIAAVIQVGGNPRKKKEYAYHSARCQVNAPRAREQESGRAASAPGGKPHRFAERAALNGPTQPLGLDAGRSLQVSNRAGHLEDAATRASGKLKALDEQPAFPEALLGLGAALMQTDDLDGAEATFTGLVELQPENADDRFNLGNALLHKGHYGPASDSYREAIRLNPKLARAHYNLGVALF